MKKKRKSGKANDINKQTKYIAPKSKTESRAHYAPEPARGNGKLEADGKPFRDYFHRRCTQARTNGQHNDVSSRVLLLLVIRDQVRLT